MKLQTCFGDVYFFVYSAISNYTKSIHHKITITEKKCEVYKKYTQDVF